MTKNHDDLSSAPHVKTKPGIWVVLSFLIVPLNALITLASSTLLDGDTAQARGRLVGVLAGVVILPLVVVAVFSISEKFRNSRSRWKIFFWASFAAFVAQLSKFMSASG